MLKRLLLFLSTGLALNFIPKEQSRDYYASKDGSDQSVYGDLREITLFFLFACIYLRVLIQAEALDGDVVLNDIHNAK